MVEQKLAHHDAATQVVGETTLGVLYAVVLAQL